MRHDATRRTALALAGAMSIALTPSIATASVTLTSLAATAAAASGTRIDDPPAEALRYHRLLQRRPAPGYLYDRFVRAWLAEASAASLEQFLRDKADGTSIADDLLLAFRFASEGRNVEAIETFRAALERTPGSPAVLFEKAKVEAATLDFDTALTDLNAAARSLTTGVEDGGIEADPELADRIATLRGQLLARTGEREAALAVWDDLLETRPDDAALHEDLVRMQIEEGEYDAALETLDRLIAITDAARERVAHRLWRADVLRDAGRDDDALTAYVELLNDVGRDSWIEREILGQVEFVYRRMGDPEALEARLDALIAADPTRVELVRRKASVLAASGDESGAIEAWRSIIERSPEDAELRAAFVNQLIAADRTDDAIEQLEALSGARPDDATIPLRLARLLHEASREDEVAPAVEESLRRAGDDVAAWMRAARAYLEFERPNDAVDIARRLLAADPAAIDRRASLADVLMETGSRDEGIAMWRAIADESDAAGTIGVARSLAGRGERDSARSILIARAETFGDDPAYLAALVGMARGGEADREILPWAERWVGRAVSPADTLRAVASTARLARRIGALDELTERLEAIPTPTIPDRCLLAELRELASDEVGADAALAPVLAGVEDVDADPRARLQAVRLMTLRRQWSEAAEMLAPLAESAASGRSATYRQLIDLHRRAGELEASLEWSRRWREVTPGATSPWLAEAKVLQSLDRIDDAISLLEDASRRIDDTGIRDALATAYAEDGRLERAESVLWGLYDDADSMTSRLRWSRRLAESVRWTEREELLVTEFEERRRQNRSDLGAALALASVHEVLEDPEARRVALLEATRIEPNNLELLLTLSRVEEDRGDLDRARRTLERARSVDGSERALMRQVELELRSGNTEMAIRTLTAPGAPIPTVADVLSFSDRLYSASELAAAADFLRRQLDVHPNDARIPYLLGAIEHERLDREDAVRDAMLAVLDADTELPTASGQASLMGPQIDIVASRLPASAAIITRHQEAVWGAFSHRQGGGMFVGFPGGGGATAITLPPDLRAARSFAIAHLAELARTMEDEGRAALADELEQRGIENGALMLSLPTDPNGDFMVTGLLEDFPEHEGLLALVGLQSAWDMQIASFVGREQLESIDGRFTERYPSVSLAVRCALARESSMEGGDAVPARIDAIIEQAARVEDPSYLDIYAIGTLWANASAFMGGPSIDPEGLGEERRDRLVKIVSDWYVGSRGIAFNDDWVFTLTIGTLVALDAHDQLAELAMALIDEHRSSPSDSAGQAGMLAQMRFSGSRRNMGYAPLSFPPDGLKSIPPFVLSMISTPNDAMVGMAVGTSVDAGSLLAAFDARNGDPLIRAMLAIAAGEDERARELLAPLLDSEQPELDPLLVAGAWSAMRDDHREAVDTLIQASFLPMSADQRRRIDSAILASATQLEDAERRADLPSVVRRSGLRLLRGASDPRSRLAIIGALEDLGLREDAERLRDRMAGANSGAPIGSMAAPRMAPGASSTASAATVVTRIRDMLADDQREDAVKLASREMDRVAQSAVSTGGMGAWAWQDQQARQLVTLVKREGLDDEVVAETDPGTDASPTRVMRFASVLSVLERDDEALARCQAALETRATSDMIVFVVRMCLENGDGEGAGSALAKLDVRRASPMFMQSLQEVTWNLQSHQVNVASAMAQMVITFVESVDDPSAIPFDLMEMGVDPIVRATMTTDDGPVPPLDVPADDHDPETDPRRLLHDRAARALLDVPASAERAFSRLLVSYETTERPIAAFDELAEQVLSIPPNRAASRMNQFVGVGGAVYIGSGNEPIVRPRSASEFLAARAAETGDTTRLARVSETLRSNRRTREADHLDALGSLYAAEGEAFLDAARALIEVANDRRQPTPAPTTGPMQTLISVAEHRDVDLDAMQDIVASYVPDLQTARRSGGMASTRSMEVAPWIAHLVKSDRIDLARDLGERIATSLVGPPEERPKAIEASFNPRGGVNPAAQMGAMWFVQFLNGLGNDVDTAFIAIDLAGPMIDTDTGMGRISPFNGLTNWVQAMRSTEFDPAEDAERLITRLSRLPFAGDIDSFQPLTMRNYMVNDRYQTVLRMLAESLTQPLDRFRLNDPESMPDEYRGVLARRTAILEWIEATEEPTFGMTVMEVALRHPDASAEDWWTALAPWSAEIAAATPEVRNGILDTMPGNALDTDPSTLTPELAVVATAMLANRVGALDTALAKIRALTRRDFADFSRANEIVTDVSKTFTDLIRAERVDEAIEILGTTKELARTAGQSGDVFVQQIEWRIRSATRSASPKTTIRVLPPLMVAGGAEADMMAVRSIERAISQLGSNAQAPDGGYPEGYEPLSNAERRTFTTLYALSETLEPQWADFTVVPLATWIARAAPHWSESSDETLSEYIRTPGVLPEWFVELIHDASAVGVVGDDKMRAEQPAAALARDARVQAVFGRLIAHAADGAADGAAEGAGEANADEAAQDDAWPKDVAVLHCAWALNSAGPALRTEELARIVTLATDALADDEAQVSLDVLSSVLRSWRDADATIDAETSASFVDACQRQTARQLQSGAQVSYGRRTVPLLAAAAFRTIQMPYPELILDRCVRLGDDRAVRRALGNHASLGASTTAWMTLLRGGRTEDAVRLVRRHWSESMPAFARDSVYDAELHAAIGELRTQLPETDLSLYAATLLMVHPDPAPADAGTESSESAGASVPSRRERLVALAREVADHEFSRPSLEGRVLALLSVEPEAMAVIRDRLTARAEGILVTAPDGYHGDTTAWSSQLAFAATFDELRRGETDRYQAILDEWEALDFNSGTGWQVRETITQMVTKGREALLPNLASADADDTAAIVALLRREAAWLVKGSTFRNFAEPALATSMIVSMMYGDVESHRVWLTSVGGDSIATDPVFGWETDEDAEAAPSGDESASQVAWPIRLGRARIQERHFQQGLATLARTEGMPVDLRSTVVRTLLDRAPFDRVSPTVRVDMIDLLGPIDIADHGVELATKIGRDTVWAELARAASNARTQVTRLAEQDRSDNLAQLVGTRDPAAVIDAIDAVVDTAWDNALATSESTKATLAIVESMLRLRQAERAAATLAGLEAETDAQREAIDAKIAEARKMIEAMNAEDATD